MRNKKAFTLVELMGVLVILGILTVILVPVVSKTIKENKERLYDKQLKNIELAAKNFGSDNIFILPNDNNSIYVTLGQLKSLGYIENIVNPKNEKEFSDCTLIEIKKENNNYSYIVDENSFETKNCIINSNLIISGPSKKYINKNSTAYYIILVNKAEEDMFLKYNIDNNYIELSGAASATATYSISGENGIYKLMLKGGEDEGELSFNLKSGAITDESGNDIIGSTIEPAEKVIVDNTQ